MHPGGFDSRFSEPENEKYRTNVPHAANKLPWTAARCNRLLRSLVLRLEQSRREQAEKDSRLQYCKDGQRSSKQGVACMRTEKDYTTSSNSGQKHPADTNCGEGLFDKRRKLKHQYTSKTRKEARISPGTWNSEDGMGNPAAGCVFVPTPYISRSSQVIDNVVHDRGDRESDSQETTLEECCEEHVMGHGNELHGHFNNARRRLKSKNRYGRQGAQPDDGLWRATGEFLERTGVPGHQQRVGAQSLLSSCLRSVSTYIQAETEWRKDADPDDKTDVQSEVYNDLETLEPSSGSGWNSLRVVTRAHGIDLIGRAIRNRRLDWITIDRLVNSTITYGTFLESQRLLEAFLRQSYTSSENESKSTETHLEKAMRFLDDYSRRRCSSAFQMRQLSGLFASGRYPIEWASKQRMLKLWATVLMSLSKGNQACDAAAHLTLSVLQSACDLKTSREDMSKNLPTNDTEALSNTISSLVTSLSATALLGGCSAPSDTQGPGNLLMDQNTVATPRWLIHSAAISVAASLGKLRHSELCSDERHAASIRRSLNLLVAELLLQISLEPQPHDTTVFGVEGCVVAIQELESVRLAGPDLEVSDILCETICSIARCCGRTVRSNGSAHLQGLVERLLSPSRDDLDSSSASFLQRLALDSALYFVHHFDAGPNCQALIRRAEASVRGHGLLWATTTPVKRRREPHHQSRDGYRWEEGICEWILVTPAGETNTHMEDHDILGDHLDADNIYGDVSSIVDEEDNQVDEADLEIIPSSPYCGDCPTLSSCVSPSADDERLDIRCVQNWHETNNKSAGNGLNETECVEEQMPRISDQSGKYEIEVDDYDFANANDVEDELCEGLFAAQWQSLSDNATTKRYQKRRARDKLRARRQMQVKRLCILGRNSESDDELCLA
ncbi:MAG: hypothetical protein Q9157_004778 [Trypethelium eluteriae]